MQIQLRCWSLKSEAFVKWLKKIHATDYILHNVFSQSDYLPVYENGKTQIPHHVTNVAALYTVSGTGPLCYDTLPRVGAPTRVG